MRWEFRVHAGFSWQNQDQYKDRLKAELRTEKKPAPLVGVPACDILTILFRGTGGSFGLGGLLFA